MLILSIEEITEKYLRARVMWSNLHFKTLWVLCNEWIVRGKKRRRREAWETVNNNLDRDGSLEYGGDSGDEEK